MSEKFDLQLEIDARDLLRDLEEVDKKRQEIEEKATTSIRFIKDVTQEAVHDSVEDARALWLTTRGVVQASGEAISSHFNLLINTAFRTIDILTPLLTAESVVPGMQAAAAIGLTNLGIATASAVAAQLEYDKIASALHGVTTALRGVSYMFGQNY